MLIDGQLNRLIFDSFAILFLSLDCILGIEMMTGQLARYLAIVQGLKKHNFFAINTVAVCVI